MLMLLVSPAEFLTYQIPGDFDKLSFPPRAFVQTLTARSRSIRIDERVQRRSAERQRLLRNRVQLGTVGRQLDRYRCQPHFRTLAAGLPEHGVEGDKPIHSIPVLRAIFAALRRRGRPLLRTLIIGREIKGRAVKPPPIPGCRIPSFHRIRRSKLHRESIASVRPPRAIRVPRKGAKSRQCA
jgi:hypothetical protein